MTTSSPPMLHPNVEPLAFLLGTWRGEGRGEYPTIQPFGYGEEVRFWHTGKPFLAYSQRTWALDDDRPLHGEMGYWRLQDGGCIELLLAHPTGVTELAEGTFDAAGADVASVHIGLTGTAKEVTGLERSFRFDASHFVYDLRMAAVGLPMTHHLHAELRPGD